MTLFTAAVKQRLKARVAIDGPTGSGKTWTALQWARILAGPDNPIGVIDTENRSAAYYAPTPGVLPERVNWWDAPYEFGHLPQHPPYDPRALATLIDAAAAELGADGVLVIDSLTHFWSGEGGTLEIVDKAGARSGGNQFAGWKEGSPAQRHLLDTIIHADCHVVATMRSKMEYVLDEVVKNGRTVRQPTKVGMAPEQRAGVEYEFTVVADMDLEHRLTVSKSRCSDIADAVAPAGRSAELAQRFAAWLDTGAATIGGEQSAVIAARFADITDEPERRRIKGEFVATFGVPSELLDADLPRVTAWLDQHIVTAAGDPATGEIVGGVVAPGTAVAVATPPTPVVGGGRDEGGGQGISALPTSPAPHVGPTPDQLKLLGVLAGKLGYKDAFRHTEAARVLGTRVMSWNDLTKADASAVIDAWQSRLDDNVRAAGVEAELVATGQLRPAPDIEIRGFAEIDRRIDSEPMLRSRDDSALVDGDGRLL